MLAGGLYERTSGAAGQPLGSYQRRAPERTVLHELVARHAQSLLAELRDADPDGGGLPRYVERELAAYLRCGILAHGFTRVRCQTCHDEIVVAFSCKRRGLCPSCTSRRMADTAAHLVDRVLPLAPYRQWVFTVPKPLRLVLARDPVGDRGTLLRRGRDGWHTIPTHTDADLRQFRDGVVVGRGGAVVDCLAWDREQRELARRLACVPRRSPTHADLHATIPLSGRNAWHAFGAAGTTVAAEAYERPYDIVERPDLPGVPTIMAAAYTNLTEHISFTGPLLEGVLPPILVGREGVLVFFVARGPPTVATIPGTPDLFASTIERYDAFAVGAHGTILHFQAQDATTAESLDRR